ncbi:hypothetical protein BX616_007796 [Lobosporangium transversale]|nr:hypothetical protein BX616_007796 [Lobosporangium transversale]
MARKKENYIHLPTDDDDDDQHINPRGYGTLPPPYSSTSHEGTPLIPTSYSPYPLYAGSPISPSAPANPPSTIDSHVGQHRLYPPLDYTAHMHQTQPHEAAAIAGGMSSSSPGAGVGAGARAGYNPYYVSSNQQYQQPYPLYQQQQQHQHQQQL